MGQKLSLCGTTQIDLISHNKIHSVWPRRLKQITKGRLRRTLLITGGSPSASTGRYDHFVQAALGRPFTGFPPPQSHHLRLSVVRFLPATILLHRFVALYHEEYPFSSLTFTADMLESWSIRESSVLTADHVLRPLRDAGDR